MAYTVKQLSKLSGVTVRTLHFYEEEGLLSPAYYGSNGYRYYGAQELLQLQQILFFKELGFTLKQIRQILGRSDFDQLSALYSHQKALTQERDKITKLLVTIEKTIQHIKGKDTMKDMEIFEGFDGFYTWAKGKGEEAYAMKKVDDPSLTEDERLILEHAKKTKIEKPEDPTHWENIEKAYNAIYGGIAECLNRELSPSSEKVQQLIQDHYTFAERFLSLTREVYEALARLYSTQSEYKKQLMAFHPKLPWFMTEAMEHFVEEKL